METTTKAPAKRRVFFDMDGVLADFDKLRVLMNLTGDEMKRLPGAFAQLDPIEGAIAGVRSVIGMGFEVWVATKPPTGIAQAYADKAGWILQHLPELKRRIIVTHHKGLLGGEADFLVDDRPHKASCTEFRGELVHFGPEGVVKDWAGLVDLFRQRAAPAGGSMITFADFVQHGRDQGVPLVSGMPWSFRYLDQPVTHENDQCYLIGTNPQLRFTPDDVLCTNPMGEMFLRPMDKATPLMPRTKSA